MSPTLHPSGYRLYWVTWVILLAMTLGMLLLEYAAWPRWILLGLLLAAMLTKAGIIAGNFMHLRYEKPALVAIVVLCLVLTSAVLFAYLAFDARHILRHSAAP